MVTKSAKTIYQGVFDDRQEGKKFRFHFTDEEAKFDCERAEKEWTGESIEWKRGKVGNREKWIGKTKYHTFYVKQYKVK